ncbi:hypothetical protein T12_10467 [Trichinella patagoniensis]|uniref:Uncharacterized protein n=1 Tax=Trichinella patagoniensis TaxID=990121 RepID=A0A0V0Y4S6_9BILA|nr:hypothetical protein T12_10467 [Trichinella patagoniensis]
MKKLSTLDFAKSGIDQQTIRSNLSTTFHRS